MTRSAWLFVLGLAFSVGCECDFFDSNELPDAGPMNQGVGDPCMAPTHCRAGLTCADDGTCQPTGQALAGAPCILTGDCAAGLYCNAQRLCTAAGTGTDGADCRSTGDCEQGLVCSLEGLGFRCRAPGTGDLGDVCRVDLDCLAGLHCIADDRGDRSCESPPVFAGDGGIGGELPPSIPFWPGVECTTETGETEPATSFFRVPRGAGDGDFYRLPFPNDIRRTSDGLTLADHPTVGSTVAVDVLGQIIAAAEEDLDGFATNPVIYFRFSRPYEWDGIGEHLLLLDITPGSPDYNRGTLGRSWLTTSGAITRYICPNWVAIRRAHGSPLRPGTTYAAIVLQGVRASADHGGDAFTRDADLDALLSDTAPSDAALADAWDAYEPLRAWLADPDNTEVTAPGILNAAVFTTQDPRTSIPAMRGEIRGQPAPQITDLTVCDDGVVSPCDDGGERRCGASSTAYWEIHARISLPQFQEGTPPYETPADGGAIARDASGTPQIQREEPVCMVMTIPRLATAPPGGFPVLFVAHGTGGAFTAPVSSGISEIAATGDGGTGAPNAVTIAIDMPLHGGRRGASTREPDFLVFNVANPRAARDNFIQGAADLMSLVYWAETYTLPAAMSPTGFDVTFDPTRMVLFAHSQGANHAGLMLPYEPGIFAVELSGAGADLTESLLTKTRPVDIASALPLALLDVDRNGNLSAGGNHPALALMQMFYEPSDPVNFGRFVRREPIGTGVPHVFMTYGMGDSFSTERTMTANARALGLTHVSPDLTMDPEDFLGTPVDAPLMGNVDVMGMPVTFGLRQYTPSAGEDGHYVSTQTDQGRADTERFLLQALIGSVPAIGE
jgi:hypothetical protein